MNRYFFILNWSLLAFVLGIGCWIMPLLNAPWLLVGSILAAMFTGGFASWRYYKIKDPDKPRRWRNAYFKKKYIQEICVQLIISLLFAWLAWWLTSVLYVVTGFAVTLAFNYIVEWLYARFIRKNPPV